MAAGLHGSARTTPRIRAELQAAELQASQETTRALASRYSLNPKTVAKWRKRTTTADQPMGPSRPRSTVLTEVEEAIVVEFRRRTLLPLDDVLGCLRESLPTLSRSALHRCLVRHSISRLPKDEESSSKRRQFAETRIGSVHVDACQLRSAEGKGHLLPHHRPCVEVRLCRVARHGRDGDRRCLYARGRGGLPVSDPHGADRQRRGFHPLCLDTLGHHGPPVRPRVLRTRDHAQADQAVPPLDQWTG